MTVKRAFTTVGLVTAVGITLAAVDPLPNVNVPLDAGVQAPYDSGVIVGIEHYDRLPRVPYAERDAQAVYETLIETRGVSRYRIKVLQHGTRERILETVDRAASGAGPESTLWFYFAGHGAVAPDTGRPLLLCSDAGPEEDEEADGDAGSSGGAAEEGAGREEPGAWLRAGGLDLAEIARHATANGARVVMMVDAGFDGTLRTGQELGGDVPLRPPVFEAPGSDTLLWLAAGPGSPAGIEYRTRHGLFTYVALGALRGWADGELTGERDGSVTGAEAQAYALRAAAALGDGAQRPLMLGDHLERVLTVSDSLEEGPDLDAYAAERGADAAPLSPRQRLERWEAHDRAESEMSTASAKMWWTAKRDWRRTRDRALAGGDEAIAALRAFIDEYGDATVSSGGVTRQVIIPEVSSARSWLEELLPEEEEAPRDLRYLRVSAGGFHTCGVTVDGEIVCWGDNRRGQCDAPEEGTFTQVSAGGYHSCAMDLDGNVWCWGRTGGYDYSPSGQFAQISAGGYHTCGVLLQNGAATCWGEPQERGNRPPRGQYRQVAAGMYHSCGLLQDGHIRCWGKIDDVPGGEDYVQISSGSLNTCGLKAYGVVLCWGGDPHGASRAPWGDYVQVTVGSGHACALDVEGNAVCWGDDRRGQASPPEGPFVSLSAGTAHTCGVREDGRVLCWGDDTYGQSSPP